ncbi:pyridine nucleotide-disulfide oxidoreductase family protein [Anopheles sinensis]|uniref:Pyridine nucleotide-disulfide oxidoreductase family protein n=1 Tax=Anopheles sinensis TaxID=74873 RepID=A0A084WMI7_ANOSI|nr:pyridine nucleotide-disulfide oxidoreductase family protein [Anopheles sinensis]
MSVDLGARSDRLLSWYEMLSDLTAGRRLFSYLPMMYSNTGMSTSLTVTYFPPLHVRGKRFVPVDFIRRPQLDVDNVQWRCRRLLQDIRPYDPEPTDVCSCELM